VKPEHGAEPATPPEPPPAPEVVAGDADEVVPEPLPRVTRAAPRERRPWEA